MGKNMKELHDLDRQDLTGETSSDTSYPHHEPVGMGEVSRVAYVPVSVLMYCPSFEYLLKRDRRYLSTVNRCQVICRLYARGLS
jgi:hypothetical protein